MYSYTGYTKQKKVQKRQTSIPAEIEKESRLIPECISSHSH